MKTIHIDKEWRFTRMSPTEYLYSKFRPDIEMETVNLPHDCNISEDVDQAVAGGRNTGYYWGMAGFYNKELDIPADLDGKRVFVQLDGSYCNTEIAVNGNQAALHPNGYTPFTVDITDYLNYGEKNRLSLYTNNSAQHTARWYSGTGVYRHVDLRIGEQIHLTPYPIYAKTTRIQGNDAVVLIEVSVFNHTNKQKKLKGKVELYRAPEHGKEVDGIPAAYGEMIIFAEANKESVGRVSMVVEDASIWDIDNPNLYTAVVSIYDKDIHNEYHLLDSDDTLFGIRTISVDTKYGLMLNGHTVKLKGGCVHHDNGILGAASFYDSEYRKMKLHKDNGYNGIRCAHNPMSKDMMEACDRLGLLVIAEAFDVWEMSKNINDYHLHFADWWQRDLEAFIKRDRNHPSIIIWSIGNEITERNSLARSAELTAKLSAYVRNLDDSRYILAAMPTLFNGLMDADWENVLKSMMAQGGPFQNLSTPYAMEIWPDRTDSSTALLDITGYNYLDGRYEEDGKLYPNRVICGTESYPRNIDKVWELVEKFPYVIGDFVWTSHDYLGELSCGAILYKKPDEPDIPRMMIQNGRYPLRTAQCGDFDLCGFEKVQLFYRRIVWGSDETYIASGHPKNFFMVPQMTAWAWEERYNSWSFEGYEGKDIDVDVYSAGDEVELILNNEKIGKCPAGKENRFMAHFKLKYYPGELTAISYKNGTIVSRQVLKTPGKPASIRLLPDKTTLHKDGQSLSFVTVEVIDKEGNIVIDKNVKMRASVTGEAVLAAFGSGAHETEENYTKGEFTSHNGRLLAIIRSGYAAGTARLEIKADGFLECEVAYEII